MSTNAAEPHFRDMTYQRVSLEDLKPAYDRLLAAIPAAAGAGLAEAVREWNRVRSRFDHMATLNSVQFTTDTTNTPVKQEKAYLDEIKPTVEEWDVALRRALLAHPQREAVNQAFGKRLLEVSEVAVQSFDPKIKNHLVREAKLKTRYSELLASAKIPFGGKTYNFYNMDPFYSDPHRATRHDALRAKYAFLADNAAELDTLYDDLVALRHDAARQLGYDNYIALGYKQMTRTDYGPDDVAVLREEVVKHVVPIGRRIRERQAKRLGVDKLMYWDEKLVDPAGTPKPQGDADFILRNTARMYNELSPETGAFFTMLASRGLYDLVSRDGKEGGGYCTFFPETGAPFIFSNFNGTKGDVEVMTHECGHAFQIYSSRRQPLLDYLWPTMEAAEIYSMGMEVLTYPWMDLFFGEDATRFRRVHMSESLLFLCYGCAVDEFQHWVYAEPASGAATRLKAWRALEAKYLPWRDYGDLPRLQQGGFWQRQSHIYKSPFYYIDYVIAQTCAFQIWQKAAKDRKQAWTDYLAMCPAGGSVSFLELLKLGKLRSPFQPGVLAGIVADVNAWLEKEGE